jgi:Flp pilus assembly protein TadG
MKFCGDELFEGGYPWKGAPLQRETEGPGKASMTQESRAERILRLAALSAEFAASLERQRKAAMATPAWFAPTFGASSAVFNPIWSSQYLTNSCGFGSVTPLFSNSGNGTTLNFATVSSGFSR